MQIPIGDIYLCFFMPKLFLNPPLGEQMGKNQFSSNKRCCSEMNIPPITDTPPKNTKKENGKIIINEEIAVSCKGIYFTSLLFFYISENPAVALIRNVSEDLRDPYFFWFNSQFRQAFWICITQLSGFFALCGPFKKGTLLFFKWVKLKVKLKFFWSLF